ncbi:hypothetical protein AB1Y20_020917 [Prymnesium parvum]|uniref:SET domain-containing protein n=1 Tax=Prymnesium parvum TaxID=97485 RepID=A0AB34JIL7_PRYPA
MEALAAALVARQPDEAARAFDELRAAQLTPEPRALAALINLLSLHRKNAQAVSAFAFASQTLGTAAAVGAGVNMNALVYACCREPANLLSHAMSTWRAMVELGVPLDTEPANKLICANLALARRDDAFTVFLGAIDAGVQPSEAACTALVSTCADEPRLGQSAFAVFLVMQNAGLSLRADVGASLVRACLETGTLEQAVQAYDGVPAFASQPDVGLTCALATSCALATPAQPARAAALLRSLLAAGKQPTVAASDAVLGALSRAALGRPNPASVNSAAEFALEMAAMGLEPSIGPLKQLLLASCRTNQHLRVVQVLGALMGHSKAAASPPEEVLMRSVALAIGGAIEASAAHGVTASQESAMLVLDALAACAPAAPPAAAAAESAEDAAAQPCGGDGVARQLLRLPLDRDLAAALVRLCCVASLFGGARTLLRHMCVAREPPMAPGVGLLATFLVACCGSKQGVVEGVAAFAQLSEHQVFSVGACAEIWESLVGGCIRHDELEAAVSLCRQMSRAGAEVSADAMLQLHAALEAKPGLEQEAVEVRTLLEMRGALAASAAPREARESRPADSSQDSSDEEGRRRDEEEAGRAEGAEDPLKAATREKALVALLRESIDEKKWDRAIDLVRQLCAHRFAPPDELLLLLFDALFELGRQQHALGVYDVLQNAMGGISQELLGRVLAGLVNVRDASKFVVRSMQIFGQLLSCGETFAQSTLMKLHRACLASDLLDDAFDVLVYVAEADQASGAGADLSGSRKRQPKQEGGGALLSKAAAKMSSELLSACIRLQQLQRAQKLFQNMATAGAPPATAQCAALIESFSARGMGEQALEVLRAMVEASYTLSVKMVCQTVAALLRGDKPRLAFEVFAEHLEHAGGPNASLGSLRMSEWNTEHTLATLTKALSKQLDGKRAHRVYSAAGSAGLRNNFASFGLPALTLACLEDKMVAAAFAVCEDARQALLPVDGFTASALLSALARARMRAQVVHVVDEAAARRLSCDAPSLKLALRLLLDQVPPMTSCAVTVVGLLADVCKANRSPETERVRHDLPLLAHSTVEALCPQNGEATAVQMLRTLSETNIMPLSDSLTAIAASCGRRKASAPLGELVALLQLLKPRLPPDSFKQATAACVGAGVSEVMQQVAGGAAEAEAPPAGGKAAPRAPARSLSTGASDLRAERGLHGAQVESLTRERDGLRTRVAQLMKMVSRRTRLLERLRVELPLEHAPLLDAAEEETHEEVEAAAEEARIAESEAVTARRNVAPISEELQQAFKRRRESAAPAEAADPMLEEARGGFDSYAELLERYSEMSAVARQRQHALLQLQTRHQAAEARLRDQAETIRRAGLTESTAHEESRILEEKLYSNSYAVFRPPENWPAEIQYCNQLLWNEVPAEYQFLRMRVGDDGAVRRPKQLKIVKIKNRKHPCFGEYGLFASENIDKGVVLLDYAGRISVVVGEESDVNRSSYLLNMFTDEEHSVYVDIDASQIGNEARFINDYHGTGQPANSQFWPYFDEHTGEKRMSIKTIKPVASGQEILVDYGGRFFEKDSSSDSDMHQSDEEFAPKPKTKRRKKA